MTTDRQPGAPELRDPAVEALQNRLDAEITALLAGVGGLSQRDADWSPGPGRWSAGEVLHHLILSNRYFAHVVGRLIAQGRRENRVAKEGSRRVWSRLRLVADRKASGPVRHPEGATPTHGLDVVELQAALEASHHAVADQIPAVAGLDLEALRARHPLGFELNLFQWVDITGAHERRHLDQIREILAALAAGNEGS